MPSRRKAREQALQVLYLMDLSGQAPDEALRLFKTNFESDEDGFEFVRTLVTGVFEKKSELDEVIEKHSENWKLSRMPRIDRNLLRLGAFELLRGPETPPPVVMDESVELAKKYGEAKTPGFVNAILDRIFRESSKQL